MRRPMNKPRPRRGQFPGRVMRKKVCVFCRERIKDIDYKDLERLSKFVTERGKIIPSRITGNCAKHQRMLARAVKKARVVAFLPFVAE